MTSAIKKSAVKTVHRATLSLLQAVARERTAGSAGRAGWDREKRRRLGSRSDQSVSQTLSTYMGFVNFARE
jgi:hypothetical protein